MKRFDIISYSRFVVSALLAGTVAFSCCSAFATEAETRDALYERSAKACTYHSRDRVRPAIQALSAEALDILPKRKVIMCPNPKLGGNLAFVWYGEHNTIVWNPDVKGAVELMAKKLDEMSRADEFPPGVHPWNADGTQPPVGTTVPGYDYAVRDDFQEFDVLVH